METTYPTRANPTGSGHADLLLGVPGAFDAVRAGAVDTTVPGWAAHVDGALLY